MNKKIGIALIIVVFLCLLGFLFFPKEAPTEKVEENRQEVVKEEDSSKSYDVTVTDDTITFANSDGTSIIYAFEGNHLANIFLMVTTQTPEEAEYLKNEYQKDVGNGVIAKVTSLENTVAITYEKSFFADYEDLTKEELQELFLGEFSEDSGETKM